MVRVSNTPTINVKTELEKFPCTQISQFGDPYDKRRYLRMGMNDSAPAAYTNNGGGGTVASSGGEDGVAAEGRGRGCVVAEEN